MPEPTLSIDRHLVNVDVVINQSAIQLRDFDTCLFLTKDTTIDAGGPRSVRTYTDLASLMADGYPGNSEPVKAGQVFFAQPRSKVLRIGRWQNDSTTVNSTLVGGTPKSVETIVAVSPSTLQFNGESQPNVISGSPTTLANIAALVQTKLQAFTGVGSGATVTATGGVLHIDFGNTINPDSFFSGPLADALGLSGRNVKVGLAQETITDALDKVSGYASSYFVTGESSIMDSADAEAMAAWAAGSKRIAVIDSFQNPATLAGSTIATIAAKNSGRNWGIGSRSKDYKSVSIAGIGTGINYDVPVSHFNFKWKQLPNTVYDRYNEDDYKALMDLRINAYADYGNGKAQTLAEGTTFDPDVWMDNQLFVDWFSNAVQEDLLNLLKGADVVPMSAFGMASIVDTIERTCARAARSGTITGGPASPDMTRSIRTVLPQHDGSMPTGYLVYNPGVHTINRATRVAPPTRVWLRGAGAVNKVDLLVTFSES